MSGITCLSLCKGSKPQMSCTQTCSPAQHDEVRGVWHELPIQAFHLPLLQHADHVQVVCVVECLISIVLQPLQPKIGPGSAHFAAAALPCRALWCDAPMGQVGAVNMPEHAGHCQQHIWYCQASCSCMAHNLVSSPRCCVPALLAAGLPTSFCS